MKLLIRDKFTGIAINGAKSKVTGFVHDTTTYADSVFVDNEGNHVNTPKIYNSTDAAANGYLEFDFLLAFLGIKSRVNIGANSAPRIVAFLTKPNSKEYALDIPIRVYGYKKLILYDFSLKGLEETIISTAYVEEDQLITEKTKSVVEAYTKLETPQKFYDYVQSWLYDDTDNSVSIDRIGGLIIANYDIEIDKTTTDVFSFTPEDSTDTDNIIPAKITIKSDSTSADFDLGDKELRLLNGAVHTGSVIDRNGDSFLKFEGIDSWQVFDAENHRDTNTNELGSGNIGDNFRFNYTAGKKYHLRLTVSGDIIFKDVTPAQKGSTLVSLSSTALLNTLSNRAAKESSLQTIKDNTDKIPAIKTETDKINAVKTVTESANADVATMLKLKESNYRHEKISDTVNELEMRDKDSNQLLRKKRETTSSDGKVITGDDITP